MADKYIWLKNHIYEYSVLFEYLEKGKKEINYTDQYNALLTLNPESEELKNQVYVDKKLRNYLLDFFSEISINFFCKLTKQKEETLYENISSKRANLIWAINLFEDSSESDLLAESASDNFEKSKSSISKAYDIIAEAFSMNVFAHINGMGTYMGSIEKLDCIFAETMDGILPLGFYRENYSIEYIKFMEKYLPEQLEKYSSEKSAFINGWRRKIKHISEFLERQGALKIERKQGRVVDPNDVRYDKVNFMASPNRTRGIIMSVASLLFLVSIVFFVKDFSKIEEIYGVRIYFLSIVNFILFIVFYKIFINGIREIKFAAYFEKIPKLYKSLKKLYKRLDEDDSVENKKLCDEYVERSKKNTEIKVVYNEDFYNSNKAYKNLFDAYEYVVRKLFDNIKYRSVKNCILMLLIAAIIGVININSSYTFKTMSDIQYKWNVLSSRFGYRGMNRYVMTEDKALYKHNKAESEVIMVIPKGNYVEILKEENVNGERWKKVRFLTSMVAVKGWIEGDGLEPYNTINKNEYEQIGISSADCNGFITTDSRSFPLEYAFDNNTLTSWQVRGEELNENPRITINFMEEKEISAIRFLPGTTGEYIGEGEEMTNFKANARPAEITVKFNGGKLEYKFEDIEKYQVIWLNKPVITDTIEIEIDSIYNGSVYANDIGISEIAVFNKKD